MSDHKTIDRADKHTKMLMEKIEGLEGTVKYLETEVEALCDPPAQARIDAALAILGESVIPGDYGSFLVVRDQVSRAVKTLRGEK